MKKKILIISMAYFPRFVGGAEVALKEITDKLADEFEFHMITLRYDSTLPHISREGSVLVHRIGFSTTNPALADLRKLPLHINKYLFQATAFLKAFSLHQKNHYDMVWSMMAHSAGIPGALYKMTHPRIPLLLTLQEGDTPEHIARKARPSLFLFDLAFRYADAVQVISNFLGGWAKQRGSRNIVVIPNGVDVKRFSKPAIADDRARIRAQANAKESDTLLVTVSRLVYKNGIDTVIEALAMMPSVRLLIAGDGPERMNLETSVMKFGVKNRVTFMGEVSQTELPSVLSACDIFIRASRSEGQGIAFIEAMAAELPTIGTDVGGIPDFIHDGKTGFLTVPNSPKGIVSAIERVQADTSHHISIAGRALVASAYDWSTIADRMRILFQSIL